MENVLTALVRHVSLVDEEVGRNNIILHRVVNRIIEELKSDVLFKALFQNLFYGGSFFDGLKVDKPNEFDIDVLMVLPEKLLPVVVTSAAPGYVHIESGQLEFLDSLDKYKGFIKSWNPVTKQLSAKKMLAWFESLITQCFNRICRHNESLMEIEHEGDMFSIQVKHRKNGPALNIIIIGTAQTKKIAIDVDLVPCFTFETSKWPSECDGFRQFSPSCHGKSGTFFVVPKMPTNIGSPDFHWRLSFQQQEKCLITGQKFGRLKPIARLIKKLRDVNNHKVASYHIKTIFMWEIEKQDDDFWHQPLAVVLNKMLQVYSDTLKCGYLGYYWNKRNNLFSGINPVTLDGIANRITRILREIDEKKEEDPFVIAKYFLSEDELELLKGQVNLTNKKKDLSLKTNNDYEELITTLMSDSRFKKMIEDIVDARVKEVLERKILFDPTIASGSEFSLLFSFKKN